MSVLGWVLMFVAADALIATFAFVYHLRHPTTGDDR